MTTDLPTLTFEQFKATRRFCADLGAHLEDDSLTGCPGYLYLEALHVEVVGEKWPDVEARNKGAFCLTIGNRSHLTDDLGWCERELYDFACGDYIKAPRLDPDRFKLTDAVVQEALDAAVLVVQRHLGVTTGDAAGMFFDDLAGGKFAAIMRAYAQHEAVFAEDEDGEG